jgi:hypothetical protein
LLVKQIIGFKQGLFQEERQKIFDRLEREERIKVEEEE